MVFIWMDSEISRCDKIMRSYGVTLFEIMGEHCRFCLLHVHMQVHNS